MACTTLAEYNGPFDLHLGEHVDEKDIVDIVRTGRTLDLIHYLRHKTRDAEKIQEIMKMKETLDATYKEMRDVERSLEPVWNSKRDFGAKANQHWFCPILFAVQKDKYISTREFVSGCTSLDYIRLVSIHMNILFKQNMHMLTSLNVNR